MQNSPQQLFYTFPSPQEQVNNQAKASSQWKNICLVVLFCAVVFINFTSFNLEAKVASRDHQITILTQKIATLEAIYPDTNAKQGPVHATKKEGSCKNKKQQSDITSRANVFFEFQAAGDGPSLLCNGTDVCATLGSIINQQNYGLFQIGNYNTTLGQLDIIVAQHAKDIAELQNNSNPNNTNPNVTTWAYNKNITQSGYTFNQMIQLEDGRLATASNSNSGGSSVLLWDINSGKLSRNLTILYSTNVLQSLIQLQDGRLLASAKNPTSTGGEFQIWNVQTGNIIQRIQFSYNFISLLQIQAGSIVGLTSQGNVAIFSTTSLFTPVKTLLIQNPIISQNPNQLVEMFVNGVSKLLVPVSKTVFAQIDTATWTIDQNITVTGANIQSLAYTCNMCVGVLGNTASNPLIVTVPGGVVNQTLNTVAYAMGLVASGIVATTSSSNNNLNIYDHSTGTLLRTMNQGMVSNGYSIIQIQGTIDGFAVASYNQGVITIFNY